VDKEEIKNALPVPNNTPYLIAVVLMLGLAIASITAIAILRPEKDNSTLYALILGSIGPTTLALLAFMKSQETHLSVNSRLEQFIQNTDRSARAEGELAGRAAGRDASDQRTDKLAENKK
jgi:hypothetical protein